MIAFFRRFAPIFLCFAFGGAFHVRADPAADLASFSTIKDVNIEKLAGGSVVVGRGPAMSFPRGLSVESCYVVRKPLAKTAEFQLQWSPVKHSELKVYEHTDIPVRPSLADFKAIGDAPSNASVKSFVAATLKLASGGGDLQLSAAEAKSFGNGAAPGSSRGAVPAPVAVFWSNVLLQRAQDFLSGGLGKLPAYETKGESVRPSEEIARLLKEAPKVRAHFSALLEGTPLAGGKGSLTPAPYWELFDIEGQGTVSFGASYYRSSPDSWQAVDAQVYASGGFYAYLTFYQMWPVKAAGQDATLVWRGDFISAAYLASLHNVERMGSSTAMMRETQKVIEGFLRDASRAP